jgi:hypothetical protein
MVMREMMLWLIEKNFLKLWLGNKFIFNLCFNLFIL